MQTMTIFPAIWAKPCAQGFCNPKHLTLFALLAVPSSYCALNHRRGLDQGVPREQPPQAGYALARRDLQGGPVRWYGPYKVI